MADALWASFYPSTGILAKFNIKKRALKSSFIVNLSGDID
jgi:hypothetical protein